MFRFKEKYRGKIKLLYELPKATAVKAIGTGKSHDQREIDAVAGEWRMPVDWRYPAPAHGRLRCYPHLAGFGVGSRDSSSDHSDELFFTFVHASPPD